MKLRDLPSVDELLRDERLASEPHDLALAVARKVLDEAREEIRSGTDPAPLVDRIAAELALARRPSVHRVRCGALTRRIAACSASIRKFPPIREWKYLGSAP